MALSEERLAEIRRISETGAVMCSRAHLTMLLAAYDDVQRERDAHAEKLARERRGYEMVAMALGMADQADGCSAVLVATPESLCREIADLVLAQRERDELRAQLAAQLVPLVKLRLHPRFDLLMSNLRHELHIAQASRGPLLDPKRSIEAYAECVELLLDLLGASKAGG